MQRCQKDLTEVVRSLSGTKKWFLKKKWMWHVNSRRGGGLFWYKGCLDTGILWSGVTLTSDHNFNLVN